MRMPHGHLPARGPPADWRRAAAGGRRGAAFPCGREPSASLRQAPSLRSGASAPPAARLTICLSWASWAAPRLKLPNRNADRLLLAAGGIGPDDLQTDAP